MKDRNYGVDALRMFVMFMVVILHILTQGGILNASERFTRPYEAGWLLQMAAFCAVDVYALILGVVSCYTKYRYRNIIELWLQVLFYTIEFIRLKLFKWLHIRQKLDLFEKHLKEKILK